MDNERHILDHPRRRGLRVALIGASHLRQSGLAHAMLEARAYRGDMYAGAAGMLVVDDCASFHDELVLTLKSRPGCFDFPVTIRDEPKLRRRGQRRNYFKDKY